MMLRYAGLVLCCPLAASTPAADREISLEGRWAFQLDPGDRGVAERWHDRSLPETVRLPGSLQEQGFGDDVTVETRWTGQVVDRSWFTDPKYAPYREPGNVKVPFWLQPLKHYVGKAWYQREVTIPESWKGLRIVIHLERAHWETRVWVDGTFAGAQESLSAPHVHDLTDLLSPGKHRLTVRVDNSMLVDVGVNAHSVSDHTQSNWNGIVGKLKLVATDPVWIDDVQVYPQVPSTTVQVRVFVGNRRGETGRRWLELSAAPADRPGDATRTGPLPLDLRGSATTATVRLELEPRLWDEFSPALYRLTVGLSGPDRPVDIADARATVFGVRHLGTEGTRFTINGRRAFFRGTLECAIFPLTGYPPTEVEPWRRIIRIAKAHGLNLIRFHSWCPPEAAFAAADELGFYFHVECAAWATVGTGAPVDAWLYREADRILTAYGNHPSFVLLAYGNEPGGPEGGAQYLRPWVEHHKEQDPRRLHTSGAGWPLLEESDFHSSPDPRIQRWGEGLGSIINAQPPRTDFDFRDFVAAHPGKPTISHEIGQWCVYPSFDEIAKYTGVLRPRNFEIFRDTLAANHMGDQARAFLMASGKLQTICYKADIEAALRTPGFGGFQLLDLHDFPGQGTALIGVLDPFWDSKGYVSADEFRRFCSSTVPLARLAKRVFTSDESLAAGIEAAHFGAEPLVGCRTTWRLLDAAGATVRDGDLGTKDVPLGNAFPLGEVRCELAGLAAPARYRLVARLEETPFENDWDVWVYPARVAAEAPAGVLVTRSLDEAIPRLRGGGKALWLAPPGLVKADSTIGFSSVFWNTAWTNGQPPHTLGILCDPAHAVFRSFPTEGHSNWQWWELIHGSAAMTLDALPPRLRPLVQPIDTWFHNRRLGLLFEARVAGGKLLVSSMDLEEDLERRVAARQLRRSVLDYMASPAFDPEVDVDPALLARLLREPGKLERLGARVRADSAAPGHGAANAIDGDPETIWHTPWGEGAPGFPHELTLELSKEVALEGCRLLPRREMQNGWIREYEVFAGSDGTTWGDAVARGAFSRDADWKTVTFGKAVRARFLRLVARSTFDGAPYASLAELDLLLVEGGQ